MYRRNEYRRKPISPSDLPVPITARPPPRLARFSLRLDPPPRMNLLVLGTTMVGCCMAAQVPADWHRLPCTMIGTALCAAAASILNQVIDAATTASWFEPPIDPSPTGANRHKNARCCWA